MTVEGSGASGKMTGADLTAIAADLDPDAPIKARTTLGGWLRSVTVYLSR